MFRSQHSRKDMLARYTVLRELGRGATGALYAARDRETGTVVALKTFDAATAEPLKRARSAAALSHRAIVTIREAGEIAGKAYVAMELLEGESLRALLDGGPIAIGRALRITRDSADGLAHAHLQGVIHRDLKPSNVIVLRSGSVKLTDFGIGRAAPPYVSPEQARGDGVDHRSDVFSLGALLYEMLAHRPPENAEPPPPSRLNQHVPYALDALVLGMLARQPGERTPGIPVVLQELQRVEDALGLAAPPAAPEPAPARAPITDHEVFDHTRAMAVMERESRRERSPRSGPSFVSVLALVVAVIAIGLAGFVYYDNSSQPAPAPIAEAPKAAPEPMLKTSTPVAEAPARPALPDPAPAPEAVRIMQPLAKAPEPKAPRQQPAPTARLVLAVSPRGEIYLDGEHHGTTPPITTLDLEPGMHRIEVRSGSRKPYLTYMTVQAGDERRIRHDFNAKRMRPPG